LIARPCRAATGSPPGGRAAGDRRGSVAAIAPVLLTMLPLSKLIERPTGMLR